MTQEELWRLAEVLLPLRDDMRALRGEVGAMKASIHDAQDELRRLHDAILHTPDTDTSPALREELRRAKNEVRGFRNELRYIRALTIRQKDSAARLAEMIGRHLAHTGPHG